MEIYGAVARARNAVLLLGVLLEIEDTPHEKLTAQIFVALKELKRALILLMAKEMQEGSPPAPPSPGPGPQPA